MSAGKRLPGTPEPMHFWAGSGGIRLAGDSWGDQGGPLVLLLHGVGQTRHAWKGTGTALGAAGYFVIALDARGHGDSEWAADSDYSADAMIDDIKCVAASLMQRPVIVGASMGGGVGLIAVGENRVDASALIMVDIAPHIEEAGAKNITDFMVQKPDGFESLEEVADTIGSYQPHRPRPQNLSGLAKNIRLSSDGRYRWHWDPSFQAETRALGLYQHRLVDCARRLELPTLLVRGGMSDVLSEEGAQKFLQLCPHSEYVNVAGAVHMVAGDRNDVFGKAVIEFLARTVPVSSA